ncbi:MAG: ABC transporter ATP-binding protein/permease [Alistipes sp.]|nr:ABC transporter ATP-binding protein/permease [Alistipes sp.]
MKKVLTVYLKPYYLRMAGGFVIKFIGTIMDLLIPWILAYMIDEIVPTQSIRLVFLWGVLMVVCAFFAIAGNILANRFASRVAQLSMETIRHDLFAKISYLSCRQVNEFTESSLVSRLTSDTYNLHNAIGMMQRLGVRAPILLIGGIIVTMTLDVSLSLVLAALLPFMGILVYLVSKKGIPMYTRQQEAVDVLIRKVRENVAGIRVIKALSKSEYEKKTFGEINGEVVRREKRAAMTMGITNPVMNFILNMGWVLVILVGAYRVNGGLTESGKIVAFLTYFTIILNAMLSVTRLFVKMSQAIASADRIMKVIDTCGDMEQVGELYETRNAPHIEFRDVTFSYNGRHNNLENISFSLNKGERLGIIGATGAGKTTLISLLLRFYDVGQGNIFIDGKDIRSYSLPKLHQMFGAAFQNDTLFEDTVYENISLGRGLSKEQVRSAAVYARIDEHIEKMENGYDAAVAIKGANLSGGQKQRVLIARALAGNPDILILDDAASALDYKTDAAVRGAINEHFKDTTTIIIAQRISSVMNCDKIMVLEEGRMTGYGTHEELMESCPVYGEISASQLAL